MTHRVCGIDNPLQTKCAWIARLYVPTAARRPFRSADEINFHLDEEIHKKKHLDIRQNIFVDVT